MTKFDNLQSCKNFIETFYKAEVLDKKGYLVGNEKTFTITNKRPKNFSNQIGDTAHDCLKFIHQHSEIPLEERLQLLSQLEQSLSNLDKHLVQSIKKHWWYPIAHIFGYQAKPPQKLHRITSAAEQAVNEAKELDQFTRDLILKKRDFKDEATNKWINNLDHKQGLIRAMTIGSKETQRELLRQFWEFAQAVKLAREKGELPKGVNPECLQLFESKSLADIFEQGDYIRTTFLAQMRQHNSEFFHPSLKSLQRAADEDPAKHHLAINLKDIKPTPEFVQALSQFSGLRNLALGCNDEWLNSINFDSFPDLYHLAFWYDYRVNYDGGGKPYTQSVNSDLNYDSLEKLPTSLKFLDFSSFKMNISECLPHIKHLKNLEMLHFNTTGVDSWHGISGKQLLELANSKPSTSTIQIDLKGIEPTPEFVNELKKFSNLKHLEIRNCTDEWLKLIDFSAFPHLKKLALLNSQISAENLKKLPADLNSLVIAGMKVSDCIEPLSHLTKLKSLLITNNEPLYWEFGVFSGYNSR